MTALVQLHITCNKKMILTHILLSIGIGLVLTKQSSEASFTIYALILTMNGHSNVTALYRTNKFRWLLHTMPITRKQIVTSTFVFGLLFISLIFTMITPFQIMNGIAQQDLPNYLITFFGFFASCIVGTALKLAFYFGNPDEDSAGDSFIAFIGAICFVMVPHSLLNLVSHEPTFYIRLFLMPIICCVAFFIIMKWTVKKYEKAELIKSSPY